MSNYGTTPPPPPPMPPGGPGYGQGPVDHPQGMLILILGILSIACVQLLGPFAWVMGNKAIREIDANPTAYSNRGIVQAGRICGIIGTVLLVVVVIAVIGLIAAGAFTSAGTSM